MCNSTFFYIGVGKRLLEEGPKNTNAKIKKLINLILSK